MRFAVAVVVVALGTATASYGARSRQPDVDPKTGPKMNKAVELLNAEKYAEAREILESLLGKMLSPYERARLENILASVAQAQGKYGEARAHLQKAIDSGGLNDEEVLQNRYQFAQMFMAEEKWKEGAAAINAWIAAGAKPNASAYYLLAIAYYQTKSYDLAIPQIQKAIEMSEKPPETWYALLVSLRFERSEFMAAIPTLKKLVEIAPTKKLYWMHLSNIYAQAEKYQEAMVPLQLAYYMGLLTEESEYRRLVDLTLQNGIPLRAAQLLTQLINDKKISGDVKDWEKLGNSWVSARDFDAAIAPLTRAASMASDGNLYVRLGEIHIQTEEWAKAVDAFNRAFEKGNLKNRGDTDLLLGICLSNLNKLKDARLAFQRALADEKSKKQAEGWLRYLDTSQGN